MKSKLLSFGEYPLVSLKEAREQRDEAKKLLAKDIDPGQHKKELRAARIAEEANTFRAVALEWYETQTTHNTPAHRRRLMFNLEKYLFPSLGRKAITSIEAQDLLAISKPLEAESTWISHRVVQICGKIFRYAIACGKLKHNITADLRGALRPIPTRHHAGLTDPLEVGNCFSIWTISQDFSRPIAPCVCFPLPLCGPRNYGGRNGRKSTSRTSCGASRRSG